MRFQHVLERSRRKQAEVDALALNDRVHADCRAMREIADLVRGDAISLRERVDSLNDFLSRPIRC